jgi:integrase
MARTRRLVGIRRKRNGWQAFIWINGKFHSEQFPLDTAIATMREWREAQLLKHGQKKTTPGTFEALVDAYLTKPEIAAKKKRYLRQLRALLDLWLEALGRERRLDSITRDDVETVLQDWLTAGLSSVTVYHRRTALRSFFVMMNGADGYNAVTGTTKPAHWHPIDRSVDYPTLARIVDAMPDERFVKRGIRRPSVAKLAVRALWHTGMPPAELMKLRRSHFEPHATRMRMPWRDKGEGTPPYGLPLSADAVAAFVAIDAAAAWGSFPPEETISRSFKRAARRICGPHTAIRLYDLRHSLGADIYRRTGDLPTVGRLLGHVEGSVVTAQYALGAHAEVDQAAILTVSAARAASLQQTDSKPDSLPANLPAAVTRRKKGRLRRVS